MVAGVREPSVLPGLLRCIIQSIIYLCSPWNRLSTPLFLAVHSDPPPTLTHTGTCQPHLEEMKSSFPLKPTGGLELQKRDSFSVCFSLSGFCSLAVLSPRLRHGRMSQWLRAQVPNSLLFQSWLLLKPLGPSLYLSEPQAPHLQKEESQQLLPPRDLLGIKS